MASKHPGYAYYHSCGGKAFLAAYIPVPGEPIHADGFYHLDGTPIVWGEPCICESCGDKIHFEFEGSTVNFNRYLD